MPTTDAPEGTFPVPIMALRDAIDATREGKEVSPETLATIGQALPIIVGALSFGRMLNEEDLDSGQTN